LSQSALRASIAMICRCCRSTWHEHVSRRGWRRATARTRQNQRHVHTTLFSDANARVCCSRWGGRTSFHY